MDFPLQKPTMGDFSVWKAALRAITSPSLELSPKLGKMLNDGYDTVLWWKGSLGEVIYRSEKEQSRVRAFRVDEDRRSTRSCTYLLEDTTYSEIRLAISIGW